MSYNRKQQSMKTSAGLILTDILPHKRKFFNKLVKNKVLDHIPQKEAFLKLKQSGVEGIELLLPSYVNITDEDIHEVKALLETYKLPAFSVHQALRFFTKTKLSEITKLFHIADMLGSKVIVIHISLVDKDIFKKEFCSALHSLEDKYRIKIGFENRERVLKTTSKKYQWHEEEFSTMVKGCGFGITLDTTHLAQAGGDIVTFFKKNKDHIVNIHLSDYKKVRTNSLHIFRYKHMPLGHGSLPIADFLKTIKKYKYQGLVTMEISTDLNGMCESARIITAAIK